MDLALTYNTTLAAFDVSLAGADLATTDTLASAVLVSLLCDRLAEPYEVPSGQDRRGWWADAYPAQSSTSRNSTHLTGSGLWLLEREKQLQSTVQRCKHYCEEALAWLVEDGLCTGVTATVFVPRIGWLVAIIVLTINGQSRQYRFEFDQAAQVWALAGEQF
jgi:phage gp46-like protein